MTQKSDHGSGHTDGEVGEITYHRSFAAPCETIFKLHTQIALLKKWWCPPGFVFDKATLNLKPGGAFHYCLKTEDGQHVWGKFVYREISKPVRLVYILSLSDRKGNVTRHPFNLGWPPEILTTITLTEKRRGQTEMKIHCIPVNATLKECRVFGAGKESVELGFDSSYEKLELHLSTLKK